MRVLSTIALTTLLSASAILYGQTQTDLWTQCSGNDADTKIAGCTALIQSGQLNSADLASAFNNRGAAYDAKGAYDQAIQDFSQMIALQADIADQFAKWGVPAPTQ